jgi:hypothetical protein
MNKNMEYLKDKINELEAKSKHKGICNLYTGINTFETNLVKDDNGDLLAVV